MTEEQRTRYALDFTEEGSLNWKKVKLILPHDTYLNGHVIIGVVLHDGNFVVEGRLFAAGEYEIIDPDPFSVFRT